nr:hypothetical protein [Tanacetum cinerariifolium]
MIVLAVASSECKSNPRFVQRDPADHHRSRIVCASSTNPYWLKRRADRPNTPDHPHIHTNSMAFRNETATIPGKTMIHDDNKKVRDSHLIMGNREDFRIQNYNLTNKIRRHDSPCGGFLRSMRVNEYTINEEIDTHRKKFNKWVLDVWDGIVKAKKEDEDEATKSGGEYLKERAILTPRNDDADEINAFMFKKLPGTSDNAITECKSNPRFVQRDPADHHRSRTVYASSTNPYWLKRQADRPNTPDHPHIHTNSMAFRNETATIPGKTMIHNDNKKVRDSHLTMCQEKGQ